MTTFDWLIVVISTLWCIVNVFALMHVPDFLMHRIDCGKMFRWPLLGFLIVAYRVWG